MKPKFTSMVAWQQAELLMQPAMIRIVDNLRKHLEQSDWEGTYQETHFPYPGYQLNLSKGDRQEIVDIWELCYQLCFSNYHLTHAPQEMQEVEIDTSLIDEQGEVDWNRLDTKAQQITNQVFASLPPV